MNRTLLIVVFVVASLPLTLAADTPIIPFGSTWKYLDNGSNQGTSWRASGFNDASWASGPAQLGYGDGDEATVVGYGPNASNKYITTYFRRNFTLANANAHLGYLLRVVRDDGVVIHLNGTEVFRQNFNQGGLGHTSLAYTAVSDAEEDQVLEELLSPSLFTNGVNTIAVELHQSAVTSSDLSFDLELIGLDANASLFRGPYLGIATPTGVTISWTTDVPTDGRIRYGPSSSELTQVTSSSTIGLHHEVALTGLSPGTTYYYAIGSSTQDLSAGDPTTFFTTHPVQGDTTPKRIWVVGDAGTGYDSQRNVRDSYLNFISNSRKADAWLMLGDNAYNHGRTSEYQLGLFHDMYEPILCNTPLWPAPGNHDYGSTANATNNTGPYYDLFALPTSAQAGGIPSNTEAYYSFDLGNIHFISLDSYGVSRATNGQMAVWLLADLAYAKANSKWIIAYWHHPPYTKGSHDSDNTGDSGGLMRDMRENILPILEQHGVDLVLSGHSHSYERSFLIDGHYGISSTFNAMTMGKDMGSGRSGAPGAYSKPADPTAHSGTVYTVCGVSGKRTTTGTLAHPAMFMSTYAHFGSMILDVTGDSLHAMFLDDTGSVIDHFDLVKPASSMTVPLKIALQGPYDPLTGSMRDDLRTTGSIPLTEPYSELGLIVGASPETIDPAILLITGPSAIVDWVLVELRAKGDPASVLASRAALVRRDGQVVDVDGLSPIAFPVPVGEYHVAVQHRNHLGVMTASPLRLNHVPGYLDLTDPTTLTWGTEAQCAINGTMALWCGDVWRDGRLVYTGPNNDRDPILSAIGGTVPSQTIGGYLPSDVDMDGTTKYSGAGNDRDRILFGIGGSTPTNVRTGQVP
jgi:hypothetical protein